MPPQETGYFQMGQGGSWGSYAAFPQEGRAEALPACFCAAPGAAKPHRPEPLIQLRFIYALCLFITLAAASLTAFDWWWWSAPQIIVIIVTRAGAV